MPEEDQTWKNVADEFSALGRRLKERFEADRTDPDTAEVGDALRRLNEAAERFGERVNGVVRDPEVREGVQRVARTLRDALGSTFEEVGEDVREAWERRRGGGASDDAGADAAPDRSPAPEPPRAVPPTSGTTESTGTIGSQDGEAGSGTEA